MKIRNKATPAVYAFFEKEDSILLSRRRNTGYRDGDYQVPAGHVEEGELPTEALIREVKEEVGVDLNIADLEFVHVSYRPIHDQTSDRVDFFFRIKRWEGEITNMEPKKCDDLNWFPLKRLPTNITAHVFDAIRSMQEGIKFKELSVDFLKNNNLYLLDK